MSMHATTEEQLESSRSLNNRFQEMFKNCKCVPYNSVVLTIEQTERALQALKDAAAVHSELEDLLSIVALDTAIKCAKEYKRVL